MQPDSIIELTEALRVFAKERDWDQFHSVKNLLLALTGEVGELVEIFQWLDEEQIEQLGHVERQNVQKELADIFLYLLRLADKLDVDLRDAALKKLESNAQKYPIGLAKGNAVKYNKRTK